MAYVYSNGEGAWIGYINNTKPGGSSGDVLIEIDSIGNKRNLYEHNGVSWALNRTADNEGPIVDDVSSVNSPLSVEFESYKADNATQFRVPNVYKSVNYFAQAQADSVVAVLRKNNMLEKAIITSYNPTSLLYIRNASKVLQTALALDSWVDTNIQVMLDNGIDIAGISSGSCTQVAVELCHSNNISVATFTLNTMANIKTFIARGVDFIYSDSINGEVT